MTDTDIRSDIRRAVAMAVRYWPNAHLGDFTPREDIRSAFKMLRAHARRSGNIQSGIAAVEDDALRHVDM